MRDECRCAMARQHRRTARSLQRTSDEDNSTVVQRNEIDGLPIHRQLSPSHSHRDHQRTTIQHDDPAESELIKTQHKQDLIELRMKSSVVSSLTSFVAIEERDGNQLQPGVRLLDVMLEHDKDLLPDIGWEGERSKLEILKEKLVNGQRPLIGASAGTSLQLSEELESLCQEISYRAGGEEKSNLMLNFIETYRSRCKLEAKARELEQQMHRATKKKIFSSRTMNASLLQI